jgi:hypothetical protein
MSTSTETALGKNLNNTYSGKKRCHDCRIACREDASSFKTVTFCSNAPAGPRGRRLPDRLMEALASHTWMYDVGPPDYCRGADGVVRDEPDEGRLGALKHHRCWKRVRALGMPRWASRLTLEITAIRAWWVQGISEADARAEGFAGVSEYRRCWEGWCLWDQNLPVWILTFIVHQCHVTEVEASADRNRGKDKTGPLFSYGPVSRRRT